MKMDTFVQLIKTLNKNSISDDTDPSNTILQRYCSPYDQISFSDSVRVMASSVNGFVWGSGTTYTAYDNNGVAYQAPSCGWYWGSGGRYS